MTQPKRFTTATPNRPPIEFTLDAIPFDGSDPIPKTYRAVPQIASGLLLEVAQHVNDQGQAHPVAALKYLQAVVHPDDVVRFMADVRCQDPYVPSDELNDLFTWLVEQYAARPTGRPSNSLPGPGTPTSGPTAQAAPVTQIYS